jgi:hypothetical protein
LKGSGSSSKCEDVSVETKNVSITRYTGVPRFPELVRRCRVSAVISSGNLRDPAEGCQAKGQQDDQDANPGSIVDIWEDTFLRHVESFELLREIVRPKVYTEAPSTAEPTTVALGNVISW